MKDVGLRIRIQRDLREQFLAACQAQDKPAAQVLREFMRAYVREHAATGELPDIENEEVRGQDGNKEIGDLQVSMGKLRRAARRNGCKPV